MKPHTAALATESVVFRFFLGGVFAPVLLFGGLIACDERPATTANKPAAIGPCKLRGTIVDAAVLVTTGVQTPTTAGEYILGTTNTTGRELRDAVAELYLLDVLAGNYVILKEQLGTITVGSPMTTKWSLNRDNPVGKRWVVTMGDGHLFSPSEIDTNNPPVMRIFIRSGADAYEVNTGTYKMVIVLDAEKHLQVQNITVNPQTNTLMFDNAKVPYPR